MRNVLSIDVEEYFHATELHTSSKQWSALPSRIEVQVRTVLELLERHKVTATFFILGWIAEHHPNVVREIARAGHEIGCHSHLHRLIFDLTAAEFRKDTEHAVRAIQNACGVAPRVYRAPCFSLTTQSMWALEILVENGFTLDSSVYPIVHDRYGIPGFGRHAQVLQTPAGAIREVPVATVNLAGRHVTPVGGGAYLRLLPYRYTAAGIRRINEQEGEPACIYFHPWEIDPDQPRVASGLLAAARTYCGLRGMKAKLDRLLSEFSFSSLAEVHDSCDVQSRAASVL